jgi:hypothetical protein
MRACSAHEGHTLLVGWQAEELAEVASVYISCDQRVVVCCGQVEEDVVWQERESLSMANFPAKLMWSHNILSRTRKTLCLLAETNTLLVRLRL